MLSLEHFDGVVLGEDGGDFVFRGEEKVVVLVLAVRMHAGVREG